MVYGSKDATRKLFQTTCDENQTSDKQENVVKQEKLNNENDIQLDN